MKKFNPNFDFRFYRILGINNHSYIQHTYVTDVVQKFYMHDTKHAIDRLYQDMNFMHRLVELQRYSEGYEDEPEDEERKLI